MTDRELLELATREEWDAIQFERELRDDPREREIEHMERVAMEKAERDCREEE